MIGPEVIEVDFWVQNAWKFYWFGLDGNNDDGVRHRTNASTANTNGEVPNLSEKSPFGDVDDKIATDLVFDIQSIVSVQTDFR